MTTSYLQASIPNQKASQTYLTICPSPVSQSLAFMQDAAKQQEQMLRELENYTTGKKRWL